MNRAQRNCRKKITYQSRQHAKDRAVYFKKHNGLKLNAYNCDQCGAYHLTSRGNIRAWISDAVTGIAMIGMCAVWCFVIYAFGG